MAASASNESKPAQRGLVGGLKSALWFGLGVAALYNVVATCYVFYVLMKASQGEFGSALAETDHLRRIFPTHFEYVNRLVVLPFPNYAAKRYYESQKDVFAEAASNFKLHPYFTNNEAKEGMTFREVLTERVKAMYRRLRDDDRMDYRVEKDRCALFEFLRRNEIAHPKVKKMWYSREEIVADVESGAAVELMENWPVFFKACHLTQQSSEGTYPISTREKFENKKDDLIDFINKKWVYRARDVDRPWQKEGDAITDVLTPSFLIQEPMQQSVDQSRGEYTMNGRVSVGLVEVRAEVIWGKVYFVNLDATTIFTRNGNIEDYTGFMGGVLHMPPEGGERVSWVRDEGYLDCVIETAELVANRAHVEYLRVDVFLNRGDPSGCVVNEISLTSGYVYFGHENYIAKLWAAGLENKTYSVFESNKPVYELTAADSA